jgi:hypothetical protein
MSTKEIQEKIVENMRRWQKVEDATVSMTSEIIAKTTNPVIRMVMEIIRADSERHYRVQELIAKSLESEAIALSTDELADIWTMVEKHIDMEKKALDMAVQSLDAIKGKKMLIQEYFLNYLKEDEAKHNQLLENFEKIKADMYPYA